MIKRLYPATGTMFVYAILLSICASLTMAQNSVKTQARSDRDRLNTIMAPGADIEAFRQEYLNFILEIQENMRLYSTVPAVKQKLDRAGLKPVASLDVAIESLSAMSQEDLTRLRDVYSRFPGWRQMSDGMMRADVCQELTAKLYAKKGHSVI